MSEQDTMDMPDAEGSEVCLADRSSPDAYRFASLSSFSSSGSRGSSSAASPLASTTSGKADDECPMPRVSEEVEGLDVKVGLVPVYIVLYLLASLVQRSCNKTATLLVDPPQPHPLTQ